MRSGNNVSVERRDQDLIAVDLATDGCEVSVLLTDGGARELALELQRALLEGDLLEVSRAE